MVLIPKGGEFWMKGGEFWRGEEKAPHRQRISRDFAIASKEVTVGQMLLFRKDYAYLKDFAPAPDCPVNTVTWYDAAAYCNWLNEQERTPKEEWCYVPNAEGKYADGMTTAPDYLHRRGYRLPTEAEWEYACRADAETAYSFGDSPDLLDRYAWFSINSLGRSSPVGSLKPNDFGLFDMQGNAWEWCQDAWQVSAEGGDGKAPEETRDKVRRVFRGGSFDHYGENVRSASRLKSLPAVHDPDVGFRPARTVAP